MQLQRVRLGAGCAKRGATSTPPSRIVAVSYQLNLCVLLLSFVCKLSCGLPSLLLTLMSPFKAPMHGYHQAAHSDRTGYCARNFVCISRCDIHGVVTNQVPSQRLSWLNQNVACLTVDARATQAAGKQDEIYIGAQLRALSWCRTRQLQRVWLHTR
jgi:hypothetical protein